ncbi:MAG TPA: HAMP domain-containing sensor histidine kinase [Holophagaceae bacterium]|nr:HAMP domain-containing sensor histidine kinase [Holophagaceae bacterium]
MNFLMNTQAECPDAMDCGPYITIRSMAMSAHDLKNLLAGILLLAERIAIESRPLEIGLDALAHRILEGGKRMQQSINILIETAAGEIREAPVHPMKSCLPNLLRQVVKSNREYALSKGIHLRCPDLGSVECWGRVDKEGLRMAVDNLVNNAIKFSPPGSEVQVALLPHEREEGSFALIQVKDQGPGLTPEDKTKAFQPFQRLSARPTAGESSAGLGLSIVRQRVERHGGKVWVESEYGQGATFCIDVPLSAYPS